MRQGLGDLLHAHIGNRGALRRDGPVRDSAGASSTRRPPPNGGNFKRAGSGLHRRPAQNKASEGATEVWSYASGNGYSATVASTQVQTTGEAQRLGNVFSGSASPPGTGTAISTRRFCTVNIVMSGGAVSAVNYQGPTGGLLTAGEQCVYAVDACVKSR